MDTMKSENSRNSFLSCLREGDDSTPFSIRRVLASIFTLDFIVATIGIFIKLSTFLAAEGWIIVALVLGGLLVTPAIVIILLLFFTTWGEIGLFAKDINSIRNSAKEITATNVIEESGKEI